MNSTKDSRLASVTVRIKQTNLLTEIVYDAILRSLFSFKLDTELEANIETGSKVKTIA